MKILINGLSDNKGGIETVVLNYCDMLFDKGYRFDFISTTGTLSDMPRLNKWGAKVYQIGKFSKNPLMFIKQFKTVVSSTNYDAFWDNRDSIANLSYLILAKYFGIKIRILHAHTSENLGGRLKGVLHIINRTFFVDKTANRYWAVSRLSQNYFYPKRLFDKVVIVPNCIDFRKYSFNVDVRKNMREKFQLNDKKVLIMVGSLKYPKNQKLAIDIVNILNTTGNVWKLIIAGDGPDKEKLIEYTKSVGAYSYITFLGLIDNVSDYLNMADIYLMPSFNEGLPVALLEAQVNGLPCLISNNISKEAIISEMVYCYDSMDYMGWVKAIENIRIENSHVNSLTENSQLYNINSFGRVIVTYLQ